MYGGGGRYLLFLIIYIEIKNARAFRLMIARCVNSSFIYNIELTGRC